LPHISSPNIAARTPSINQAWNGIGTSPYSVPRHIRLADRESCIAERLYSGEDTVEPRGTKLPEVLDIQSAVQSLDSEI
jgi:hypothetical protein